MVHDRGFYQWRLLESKGRIAWFKILQNTEKSIQDHAKANNMSTVRQSDSDAVLKKWIHDD